MDTSIGVGLLVIYKLLIPIIRLAANRVTGKMLLIRIGGGFMLLNRSVIDHSQLQHMLLSYNITLYLPQI